MAWPKFVKRYLSFLKNRERVPPPDDKHVEKRRWNLWQLEPSIACNLKCIMCPWKTFRGQSGNMDVYIWEALRPYLAEVQSIDFTGGGEPLLQPRLAEWIREAKAAGCKTGFLTNGLILNKEMVHNFISAGTDWIAFSIDGATADIYEKIRIGSNFEKVCKNVAAVSDLREGNTPLIMINFVMMGMNFHQIEDIVRLSAKLGVDQVNFKQCDVIRGENGRDYGLFALQKNREVRRLEKAVGKARRLAKKLKIQTTAFAFTPDELSVCAQDPRGSLFVRHDGYVAPCINLAFGGHTTFLKENATIPTVHYGRLPDQDLLALWETISCRFYRERFSHRVRAHDAVIAKSSFEASLPKLRETLQAAKDAMPEAPPGCNVCHYLYGI